MITRKYLLTLIHPLCKTISQQHQHITGPHPSDGCILAPTPSIPARQAAINPAVSVCSSISAKWDGRRRRHSMVIRVSNTTCLAKKDDTITRGCWSTLLPVQTLARLVCSIVKQNRNIITHPSHHGDQRKSIHSCALISDHITRKVSNAGVTNTSNQNTLPAVRQRNT